MANTPKEELEEIYVRYPTIESAVRAGLIKSVEGTGKSNVEYGGIVFQDKDGKFYLSNNGPNRGKNDTVGIRGTPLVAGDKPAALYHSHPSSDATGIFSEDDIAAARQLGVPFYMGMAGKKTGKVYDPSVDTANVPSKGSRGRGARSEGRPFLPGQQMVRQPLLPEMLGPFAGTMQ